MIDFVLKTIIKAIMIIVGILPLNESSKLIQMEALFIIVIKVCIILYIVYVNTSIRKMKRKIDKLERKIEQINQSNEKAY